MHKAIESRTVEHLSQQQGSMSYTRRCTVVFSIVILLSSCAQAKDEDEVCYGELGCFSLQKPWSSITRLNFPPPQSPEKIGTSFQFFTRKRPDGTWVMTWPFIDLTGSDYDGSRWTMFIVHGFGGSITDNWMHDMKDAFLQKMDANVILVGWAAGSKVPYYSQAASNTRVVGSEMARLGSYLIMEKEASPKRFHLIGHSLGAHTAAYMAKRIPGVARLTGLDVAHIYFADEKPSMRFHRSDAMFVEAIHTDAKPAFPFMGMALYQPVGHVDFYMNGGWDQPGCQFSRNDILRGHVDEGFEDVVDVVFKRNASSTSRKRSPDDQVMNVMRSLFWQILCPHFRSCLYYTEAVRNENCTFWGRARSSTRTILSILSRGSLSKELISPADCSLKSCTPLGLYTPEFPARGSFHVATSKSPPFCIKENPVDKLMAQEMNRYKRRPKTS